MLNHVKFVRNLGLIASLFKGVLICSWFDKPVLTPTGRGEGLTTNGTNPLVLSLSKDASSKNTTFSRGHGLIGRSHLLGWRLLPAVILVSLLLGCSTATPSPESTLSPVPTESPTDTPVVLSVETSGRVVTGQNPRSAKRVAEVVVKLLTEPGQ